MASLLHRCVICLSLHLSLRTEALQLHEEKPLWEYVDLEVKPQHLQKIRRTRRAWPMPANFTDPKIGTGGHGHTFPGATTPWGMVQVTPWIHDSGGASSWDTQSGYHADVDQARFYGMAHTALSGAGSGEMGELRLLPLGQGHDSYMHLNMKTVTASVGYFSAYVMPRRGGSRNKIQGGVFVESTAAQRGGIHKFTFRANRRPSIEVALGDIPDAFWGYQLVDHTLGNVSDRQVEGCASSRITGIGQATSLLCFAIEFNQPFSNVIVKAGSIVLDFGLSENIVHAHVGVSRTDMEHARGSLSDLKSQGRGFAGFVASAREMWTRALGVVKVDMEGASRKTVLYTALYHSMISPSLLSDADGSYRLQGALDPSSGSYSKMGEGLLLSEVNAKMPIRRAKHGMHMYSTFSLWDTYRTLHPLMNLIHPDMSKQFGGSLMTMAETWGYLPPWQLIQSPADMMNGDGGSIVLGTMARNGILDSKGVFEVVRSVRRAPVDERKYLDDNGVVPEAIPEVAYSVVPEHVSRFLEQAKADHCVSSLASDLQMTSDAEYFHRRSDLIFGMWNETLEVFSTDRGNIMEDNMENMDNMDNMNYRESRDIPIASNTEGSSDEEIEGSVSEGSGTREQVNTLDTQTEAYTEGSARQYSWAADFDMGKMMQLRGGKERMACKLDQFFDGSTQTGQADMSGNMGSASLGNEPTMHTPFLYSRIGYPSRTQFQVDRAVKELFSDGPGGLPGNDDLGQMSSWIVFLLLGLYPSECSNEYILGRPFVSSARLSIKGNVLAINVVNQTDDNKYVQRATWQGQELDLENTGLTFGMLSKGGALQVWMSSSPAGPTYSCSGY